MKKYSSLSTLFFSNLLLLLLSLPPPLAATKLKPTCNPDDKKALLQIKSAFNNHPDLSSWNPTTDCCQWKYVTCDTKPPYGVVRLYIDHSNISGRIPAAVGDLSYLRQLMLQFLPNLVGPVPSSILNLSDLKLLSIINNVNLSGSVPGFLSKLKNLKYLDLSAKSLTGRIPPQLSQLRHLYSLRLDGNKLTGPIPDSFGNFRPSFKVIFLSQNQLSGNIPISLGNLNLSAVVLSENNLTGGASFLFGSKNRTIETVLLDRNSLRFNLSEVVEYPETLISLDLSHNKIYGGLPKQLLEPFFHYFNVSWNELCGSIPQGGIFQNIDVSVYEHNKCLCGNPLPRCK